MSRNTGGGRSVSNYERPNSTGPFVFYEQTYTDVGPREWIYLPDCMPVKVVVSGTGAWSAFIEGTASPPNDIEGILVPGTVGVPIPITYPLTDTVTDVTPILVQGETAIRINSLGGTVSVSVRC